jgi:hypothetical protein
LSKKEGDEKRKNKRFKEAPVSDEALLHLSGSCDLRKGFGEEVTEILEYIRVEKWLDANYSQVLPKSLIGQAITFT